MVFPGQLQLDQHHSACAGGQRKPRFLCATCGAGFDLRNSYFRHTQTHQLRFVCATCGRSLSRRSHLRNHMRRVHGLADDVPLVAVGERVSKAVEPGPTPSLLDAATTAGVVVCSSRDAEGQKFVMRSFYFLLEDVRFSQLFGKLNFWTLNGFKWRASDLDESSVV